MEDKEQLNHPMKGWQIQISLFIMGLLHGELGRLENEGEMFSVGERGFKFIHKLT